MNCDFCSSENINGFTVITRDHPSGKIRSYCSERCVSEDIKLWNNLKKQKHEEIKRMAWEIYFQQVKLDYDPPITLTHIFNSSWEIAEEFYNRAKEKEEMLNA